MSGLNKRSMVSAAAVVVVCVGVLGRLASGSPVVGPEPIRCAPCTPEKLSQCPAVAPGCQQVLREPGCGCCMACALEAGAPCGIHTAHCGQGLRCSPRPGEPRPLHALTRGQGVCTQDQGQDHVDSITDQGSLNNLLGLNSPLDPRDAPEVQESIKAKVNNILSKLVHEGPCHIELHAALDVIASSQQTLGDKFTVFYLPNCDKYGNYKAKQEEEEEEEEEQEQEQGQEEKQEKEVEDDEDAGMEDCEGSDGERAGRQNGGVMETVDEMDEEEEEEEAEEDEGGKDQEEESDGGRGEDDDEDSDTPLRVLRPLSPGHRPPPPGHRPPPPWHRPPPPGHRPSPPGHRPLHPDTAPLQLNTLSLHPDTGPLHPDTAPLQLNTLSLHPDTAPLQLNTLSLHPDTGPLHPDTGPLHLNTLPLHPDTLPFHPHTPLWLHLTQMTVATGGVVYSQSSKEIETVVYSRADDATAKEESPTGCKQDKCH
ncbi:hypothetical protein CRUP_015809 [Coryphaenoides rupestris]|nr:hypothetical protein CRUP_015809 [Coryphaenoides rupestris]